MKKPILSGNIVFASFLGARSVAAPQPSQTDHPMPNIVIVITDDQGYGDLGSRGNHIIKTPNLDRLHAETIRFTNFHVSTTCAPSRGSLMTGRHLNRINTYHTITGRSLLFEDERTLPQVLGKAHLFADRKAIDYQQTSHSVTLGLPNMFPDKICVGGLHRDHRTGK